MRVSRRQALKISAAAAVSAALAACGAQPPSPSLPAIVRGGNTAASKADGRILFAKVQMTDNGGKDDGLYSLDNARVRKVLSKADGDFALAYPCWSPDGKQIAFARAGDRGIYSDLWIMDADTSNPRQITKFKSAIAHNNNVDAEGRYVKDSSIIAGLSWSQGGNFITFASDRLNGTGAMRPWTLEKPAEPPTPQTLHVIAATTAFSQPNTGVNFHIDNTDCAPDGSAMAFVGLWAQPDNYANKQSQIYLLDFGTKKYAQLTDMPTFKWGAYDPAFSPDGQYLAFAGRPDYRVNDLFIMTRDGKSQTQITNTGAARAPVWSPDGKKLAFLAAFEGAQFNIYVMDVSPSAPGTPLSALNFGKPEKLTDEKGIDARSGLSWTER